MAAQWGNRSAVAWAALKAVERGSCLVASTAASWGVSRAGEMVALWGDALVGQMAALWAS